MTEAKNSLTPPSYLTDEAISAIRAASALGDEAAANAIASSSLARLSELDAQFVGELLQQQRNAVVVHHADHSATALALHEVHFQA